ncbi:extracellular solute-binding protein [Paenibacillus sp. N1-5-1-14]|uniref:extracellular solute-binding protein n=1 Tax=Paenibacillus radicibacter TaxID=2972488 RepID=UPI00215904FD|nr:extracellular solute-binding protein [Paenibacillus radicibacter]MCR8642487.1 extracellular solute-binding protein [Paenibacillus radicibacter]
MMSSLAVVLGTGVIAGCGSQEAASTNTPAASGAPSETKAPAGAKVKLSLWHNFTGEDLRAKAMRGIIEQYQKDHPNVDLEIQAIPPDGYKARLKTVAAGNEMPDVFIMQPGTITREFVSGELIQPVNDLLDSKSEWKNGFMPNAFDDFTVDGKTYSAPMGLSPTSILYYNKKIFEQNGLKPPTTWDELLQAVDTLKKKNLIPIALGNKANWVAQSCIISSLGDRVTGSDWFRKAVKQDGAKFTDPEFVKALTYLQDLGKAGAFQEGFNSIDGTQMEQLFIQGKAAMMIEGGWGVTNLAGNSSKEFLDSVGATILPSIPGGKGDPQSTSSAVGSGLGLSKKVAAGDQKKAAHDLIYAMSGPEAQKKTLESNNLVSYKVDLDKSKVSSLFAEVYELMSRVKRTPVYDGYLTSAGTDAVNNGLQELLLGAKPEDVAKKIQDAQAKALGK